MFHILYYVSYSILCYKIQFEYCKHSILYSKYISNCILLLLYITLYCIIVYFITTYIYHVLYHINPYNNISIHIWVCIIYSMMIDECN